MLKIKYSQLIPPQKALFANSFVSNLVINDRNVLIQAQKEAPIFLNLPESFDWWS